MKKRIAIAIAVGILLPTLPLFLGIQLLAAPGILAVMFIWGPHGPVPSDIVAIAVPLVVNAVVYGLITLGVLRIFLR
jgi:hypothetical protein